MKCTLFPHFCNWTSDFNEDYAGFPSNQEKNWDLSNKSVIENRKSDLNKVDEKLSKNTCTDIFTFEQRILVLQIVFVCFGSTVPQCQYHCCLSKYSTYLLISMSESFCQFSHYGNYRNVPKHNTLAHASSSIRSQKAYKLISIYA